MRILRSPRGTGSAAFRPSRHFVAGRWSTSSSAPCRLSPLRRFSTGWSARGPEPVSSPSSRRAASFPEILGPLAEQDYERALEWLLASASDGDAERRERIREVMVAIFQELGQDHPLSASYRRRLATALY